VGQQCGDQFLLFNAAGLGLEHQAHGGVLVGLVAHHVQHRKHAGLELGLVLRQSLFAGLDLGVGQLFNFFQHALAADAGRQLGDHQLPLATGQVFNLPAGTHLERAAPGAVGIGNIGGAADDLAATRVIRAGHQCGQQHRLRSAQAP
jgi:hypothetical protein